MRSNESRAQRLAVPALVAILLTAGGCAGYRLGSTPPPGIRSVNVPTFVNHCGEPLAEVETTRAVIQEFQKDGNLWIAQADQADAILKVTLTAYRLDPLRYDRSSGKTTREYRVTITAQYTLESTKEHKVLANKQVRGDTTFDFPGDLYTARKAAMPRAAQDLAHNLVESVVDYW
jgi:hypothetical protein